MEQTIDQRQQLLKLMDQKQDIEKEISTIVEILENMHGNPGLKGNLVDSEGFPRADIDIIEVRKLRNRRACLQTDHSVLMKEIENRLYGIHSVYKEACPIIK